MKLRWLIFLFSIVLSCVLSGASLGARTPQGPTLRYLYVNNDTPTFNSVSGFLINDEDGSIAPLDDSPFLTGGSGGRPDPDFSNASIEARGRRLFAINSLSNSVSVFDIQVNGLLAPVAGSPFPSGGVNPLGLTTNETGELLFVTNHDSNNIAVFSVSQEGSLKAVPGSPFSTTGAAGPTGLDLNISGSLLFVGFQDSLGIFAVSPTGQLTPHGALVGTGFAVQSLALERLDRYLYVGAGGLPQVAVYTLEPNGALTPATGSPVPNGTANATRAAVAHPASDAVFTTADTDSHVSVFRQLVSGVLQPVAGSPFATDGVNPRALTIHPDGDYAYLANRTNRTVSVLSISAMRDSLNALRGFRTPTGALAGSLTGLTIASIRRSPL